MHRMDGAVGSKRQPPLAKAVTQRAGHPSAKLQLIGTERASRASWNLHPHRTAGRLAKIVLAANRDDDIGVIRVDKPQTTNHLRIVEPVEHIHAKHAIARRHCFLQVDEQPFFRAPERMYVDVQRRSQSQPPMAFRQAETRCQPLGKVAVFQIRRAEMSGGQPPHRQHE